MRLIGLSILALLVSSCVDKPNPNIDQPIDSNVRLSKIVAYVHWEDQGLPGKQVVLLQTGDTLVTDSMGLAHFNVPPGRYVVRALGINQGGPAYRSVDFEVKVQRGMDTKVDIIDCLPCV
jgi:uncharacterized protein (DUF2141 family)